MKYLNRINEAFAHKWNKKESLIIPIWDISEDDVFAYFSDIEDEFDVEIDCEFMLQSPKGAVFSLKTENEETIESYAAANFKPLLNISIDINTGDVREVQSVLMDCIQNFEGYSLFDINKSRSHIRFKLIQDSDGSSKKIYHQKSNSYFSEYVDILKKNGYKVIVNKVFESSDHKFYIKYPSTKSKKLYSIVIEKLHKNDISIIDVCFESKQLIMQLFNKIENSGDFNDVKLEFKMDVSDHQIAIRFLVQAYEN